jgi:aminoglycoside phosphotransferase (APT) family kinase protein
MAASPSIDVGVARRLVDSQFPQWAGLPLEPVVPGGWDNRTFRLGDELAVRIPSSAAYAAQPPKEHRWLPRLAARLSWPIPAPVALGAPSADCPWPWTVCKWLPGDLAAASSGRSLHMLAMDGARQGSCRLFHAAIG